MPKAGVVCDLYDDRDDFVSPYHDRQMAVLRRQQRIDCLVSPRPQAYFEPINWHRTALHELGYATSHASHVGRYVSGSFGTKKYAFEELVAEINAAFCGASIGIVPTVRHADYVGSWLKVLREDNRAIVRAASQANKAADYLLSFRPPENEASGVFSRAV